MPTAEDERQMLAVVERFEANRAAGVLRHSFLMLSFSRCVELTQVRGSADCMHMKAAKKGDMTKIQEISPGKGME